MAQELEPNLVDVEQLSAIGYARLHGIAADYLKEPIPDVSDTYRGFFSTFELSNDDDLPKIELPPGFNINERLALSKEAAQLLASITSTAINHQSIKDLKLSLLDVQTIKKLRVEEPLLTSDHEADCKEFRSRGLPQLEDPNFPMEELNDELDEGLGWPSEVMGLPGKWTKDCQNDKIEVSRETMIYLQTVIKESWTEADNLDIWESATTFKRVSS
jgi:hypothetical protein